MATVVELPGRSGAIAVGGDGKMVVSSHVRRWLVTFALDDANSPLFGDMAPLFWVQAHELIGIGSVYSRGVGGVDTWAEIDGNSRLVELRAEQQLGDQADGYSWIVTGTYGYLDWKREPNPLDTPPQIAHDQAQFSRIADRDKDDEPILNSAGDAFDPPLEADDSRSILRVRVFLKEFDPLWAEEYRDTINATPFMGRDPFTCKLSVVKAEQLSDPNVPGDHLYWIADFEFHHNRDTWLFHVLDQGMRQLDPAVTTPPIPQVTILVDGQLPTSPVLLDGNGAALPAGDDPVFLEFHYYPEKDYAADFGFGGDPGGGS